jgi:HTH-type transcriptional regulator/antitoxin HigA
MSTVLDFTKPHVLRSEEEYEAAIAEIEQLLDRHPEPGTEVYERLEFLSVLAEAYEKEHDPVEAFATTPQAVVDFMLEQRGMNRAQLADVMGGRSRVSDFFNERRPLSRSQIIALRNLLGIPADLLL